MYLLHPASGPTQPCTDAPCRRMRARRRRRCERNSTGPTTARQRRSARRLSEYREEQLKAQGVAACAQVLYAPGSQSSWALPCGTFAALAWRGFTRNGSSWRPLPSPQKQPLCWGVFAPVSVVWMPTRRNRGVHLCAHVCAHTCARSSGVRGHSGSMLAFTLAKSTLN